MFWAKFHKTRYELLIAICDKNILEKELKIKKAKIKISKYFYGDSLIDENVAVRLMERATIGNLIGKDIVNLAGEKGFITKENVILIDGIPHAQFVKK